MKKQKRTIIIDKNFRAEKTFSSAKDSGFAAKERTQAPFFEALLKYVSEGKDSWHCPGHSGGAAFLKTDIGRKFHAFFGENMLKADVCNAVEQLGQLLEHSGPVDAAEKNAARIFGADHLFFVTNGTSTANKIVWHSLVGPDDIVVVDRNCHKSNLHAIMMTGAIPVYLRPTRNQFGLIGPIPEREFTFENIQKKIDAHPLIQDKSKKPRILTLTQSTYDGISYNVEVIKQKLDGKIHALHFDEAWIPHAAFHEMYQDYHAMGHGRPRAVDSLIFATQSTHKFLAGLSQASQILVQDAENKKLNRHLFNESYLMHTSTSPQYSIIASCDVAAAMMEGADGQRLTEESIQESKAFRKAMKADTRVSDLFRVWGPSEEQSWHLSPKENWHGFPEITEGFNSLDPIKVTVLTAGLNRDGEFSETGIPAQVVAKYFLEKNIIVEKYGLYSLFFMFTIGTKKGRWKTLLKAIRAFKKDYDTNEKLSAVMPLFIQAQPTYKDWGLKDLCQKIHAEYKAHDIARQTTAMYTSEMSVAMKPADAFAKITQEKTERVEIDALEGRITAVLLTPYPPGIPLLVPGERFCESILHYLKFARAFNAKFPGFETDVHGLVAEVIDGEKKYFVDCVVI